LDPRPADPLVIRSIEFLGGLASVGGWRPEITVPEVAFAGRSNVGKSSLLNALVRRKAFARVSRTPGRTREINFFLVNGRFVFTDLPGYGYARVSKTQRAEWEPLIESYLRGTKQLKGIVQIYDSRRDLSPEDRTMLGFLAETGVPAIFVATKVDKFTKRAAAARVAEIEQQLAFDGAEVIPFSSVTGEGRDEVAAAIEQLLSETGGADET
jgi:GTP-binding protein